METNNNQKFLIRCDRAGVFYGEIAERNGNEAVLTNVRNVHGWDGACSLMELALRGPQVTGGHNRWSVTVPQIIVTDVIQIIPVSKEAEAVIEALPVWEYRS